MDRNSNSVKIERIRRAIEAGEYPKALELAKTVDTARIKSAADLSVVAEAYFKNSEYETALVYFEQIYQKKQSRRILISLINLCLKLSMADMAESYLKDFEEMAPQDFYCHIFRYRIDKLRGEALDVLIYDLEQLKEDNYMEDWAYELAKLYHKNGQAKKCVAECDDIILWFGSGTYVERARGLRAINLSDRPAESLADIDRALVKEVRSMVDSGKSAEEVENFIEESTMPEGKAGDYSEEEYRKERFGKPPVYEEEGKDVIWYTKEFGPITEEMIRQQNTMDMLQGMQVAQQIKMQMGKDREMQVEGAKNPDAYTEHFPPRGGNGEKPPAKEDVPAEAFGEEEFFEDGIVAENGIFGEDASIEGGLEENGAEKAMPREVQFLEGGGIAKEAVPGAVRMDEFQKPGEDAEARLENRENAKEEASVKKGIWARHMEKKKRKMEEKKKKKEKELQDIMQSALGEEKLYNMLMEEEQAAELSRAVQSVADEIIITDIGQGSPKEKREIGGQEGHLLEEKKESQGRFGMEEMAESPKEAHMEEMAESLKEAHMEKMAGGQEKKHMGEKAESQKESRPKEITEGREEAHMEEMAEGPEEAVRPEGMELQEEPVPIFQYPDVTLPITFDADWGRFYSLLEKNGKRPEDFFAPFMVSVGFRQKLLHCMEQLFEPDNQNITMIITGNSNSGKTLLAKAIAKCLQELGVMISPKVAIIRGRKLNRIRLAEKKDQLKDTTLIIEAASEMLPGKIAELLSMKEEFMGTTAVILEDERSKINRILQENQELGKIYEIRADLPEWLPDDLFLQALAMLAAKDFQIKETVAAQFLENIRKQIEENLDGALEAVYVYTEQVIRRTEKRMAQELKTMILEGRYAEADLMLLKTEDL